MDALVITPVKDSTETVRKTISAVAQAEGDFEYIIFNDFSQNETTAFLTDNQETFRYRLINLADHTSSPSPNYKLVLQMAQKIAVGNKVPLIVIESDVVISKNSITELTSTARSCKNAGIVGMVTVNHKGDFNFPYAYVKNDGRSVTETSRSLSFCCTLISHGFLEKFSFENLPEDKDWYDIYISRRSLRMGFQNYLVKKDGVLHIPHSSRPWKQLKYTHPVRYYFLKFLRRRDRI